MVIVVTLDPPNPEAPMTLNIDVPGSPDKSFSLCGVLAFLIVSSAEQIASGTDP